MNGRTNERTNRARTYAVDHFHTQLIYLDLALPFTHNRNLAYTAVQRSSETEKEREREREKSDEKTTHTEENNLVHGVNGLIFLQ